MNKENYWQIFLATGSPAAYLMYKRAQEEAHVSDGPGHSAAGDGLQ